MDVLLAINSYIVTILLLIIGWQDVTSRLIRNRNLAFLILALCPMVFLSGAQPNLILSAAVLLIGFPLFLAKVLGAGDVKLIATLALACTTDVFYSFLLLTALLGGFLALIGLFFFHKNTKEHGIPYGVAISLAFIFSYHIV
ncbi:A24 family peptidase [Serratia sp. NA_112.1]|uniref:A24 family peptidase n=1 Tax=unclassified Serratia (in: enterobacteria) TaxID=2647522 RepID=UPI004046DA25